MDICSLSALASRTLGGRWTTLVGVGAFIGLFIATEASYGATTIMPLGDSITLGVEASGVNHGGYRFHLWNKLTAPTSPMQDVDFIGLEWQPPMGGPANNQPYDSDHEGHDGWKIEDFYSAGAVNNPIDGILSDLNGFGATPDIILLHLGTNDLSSGQSATSAAAELAGFIDHLFASPHLTSTRIMVAGIIGIPDEYVWSPGSLGQVPQYNALVADYVDQRKTEGKNIEFVDIYSSLNYLAGTTDFALNNNNGLIGPGLHPSFDGYEKIADAWYAAIVPEPTLLGLPVFCLALLRRRARCVA